MNLAELITTHKGKSSYADLARRGGGVLSDKRFQQLATGRMKEFPTPAVLRSIAKALGVGESAVVLSAAESVGLDVRRPASKLLELLPGGTEDLTDEQARAIAELVRSITPAPGPLEVELGDWDELAPQLTDSEREAVFEAVLRSEEATWWSTEDPGPELFILHGQRMTIFELKKMRDVLAHSDVPVRVVDDERFQAMLAARQDQARRTTGDNQREYELEPVESSVAADEDPSDLSIEDEQEAHHDS